MGPNSSSRFGRFIIIDKRWPTALSINALDFDCHCDRCVSARSMTQSPCAVSRPLRFKLPSHHTRIHAHVHTRTQVFDAMLTSVQRGTKEGGLPTMLALTCARAMICMYLASTCDAWYHRRRTRQKLFC